MRITHLNGWRAVEAVIRTGSVGAAARELGVTNAAVGAQLRGLEDQVGGALFDRMPGGLLPNDRARGVSRQLTDSFAAIAAVQEELSTRDSQKISLAVTQTFAETWLPRHLPSLFARINGVDLRLDTRWEVIDLATSGHDFAIRFLSLDDTEFEALPLLPSGVVPVCTPGFAERYGLTPDNPDLEGVPLVHVNVQTTDPDWVEWPGWSARTGQALPDGYIPCYSLSGSGLQIALSGIGLVLGGLSEVQFDVVEGRLVMPFGPGSVVPAKYWHQLIWPRGRRLRKTQENFRAWINECASENRAQMSHLFGI